MTKNKDEVEPKAEPASEEIQKPILAQCTLEEAKFKLCPMSFNIGPQPCLCFGNVCQAWRWMYNENEALETRLGYCGMAVKP